MSGMKPPCINPRRHLGECVNVGIGSSTAGRPYLVARKLALFVIQN